MPTECEYDYLVSRYSDGHGEAPPAHLVKDYGVFSSRDAAEQVAQRASDKHPAPRRGG
jgi:hypothetical protein